MRSPINTHGAIVATLAMRGMIELSAIRRLRTPLTRCFASTTLGGARRVVTEAHPCCLAAQVRVACTCLASRNPV